MVSSTRATLHVLSALIAMFSKENMTSPGDVKNVPKTAKIEGYNY